MLSRRQEAVGILLSHGALDGLVAMTEIGVGVGTDSNLLRNLF